jgi:hypothetical protein
MTQAIKTKQFECAQRATAEQALRGLSDKDRVHFALKIMMETNDPDAVAALRWAQARIVEHADVLVREAFERECA